MSQPLGGDGRRQCGELWPAQPAQPCREPPASPGTSAATLGPHRGGLRAQGSRPASWARPAPEASAPRRPAPPAPRSSAPRTVRPALLRTARAQTPRRPAGPRARRPAPPPPLPLPPPWRKSTDVSMLRLKEKPPRNPPHTEMRRSWGWRRPKR